MDVNVEIDKNLTVTEVVELRLANGWDGIIEEWEQCLKQYLVAVSARTNEGRLVGVGFISGSRRHAEIVDLVVHTDFRKHGLGATILDKLIQLGKEMHIHYFGLTYDKKSPWLKSFYEDHGFKSIDFAMWHEDSLG